MGVWTGACTGVGSWRTRAGQAACAACASWGSDGGVDAPLFSLTLLVELSVSGLLLPALPSIPSDCESRCWSPPSSTGAAAGSLDMEMLLRRLLPVRCRSLPADECCDADDDTWLCRRSSFCRAWLRRDLMLDMAAVSRRPAHERAFESVTGESGLLLTLGGQSPSACAHGERTRTRTRTRTRKQ